MTCSQPAAEEALGAPASAQPCSGCPVWTARVRSSQDQPDSSRVNRAPSKSALALSVDGGGGGPCGGGGTVPNRAPTSPAAPPAGPAAAGPVGTAVAPAAAMTIVNRTDT
jgi:hypothetical protein